MRKCIEYTKYIAEMPTKTPFYCLFCVCILYFCRQLMSFRTFCCKFVYFIPNTLNERYACTATKHPTNINGNNLLSKGKRKHLTISAH